LPNCVEYLRINNLIADYFHFDYLPKELKFLSIHHSQKYDHTSHCGICDGKYKYLPPKIICAKFNGVNEKIQYL